MSLIDQTETHLRELARERTTPTHRVALGVQYALRRDKLRIVAAQNRGHCQAQVPLRGLIPPAERLIRQEADQGSPESGLCRAGSFCFLDNVCFWHFAELMPRRACPLSGLKRTSLIGCRNVR